MNMTSETVSKRESVIKILKEFKTLNPWQGTYGMKSDKYIWLFRKLRKLFGLEGLKLIIAIPTEIKYYYSSGSSTYGNNTIVLRGRFSVITFLHEFGHALGMNQKETIEWSCGLFKEVFPEKWKKLTQQGGLMIKR